MIVHGVRLIAENDMVLDDQRKTGGLFEPESMAAWLSKVRPDAVMVDVGCYTGLYAIAAALKGARVFAFEPSPAAFQRAQDNAALNGVEIGLSPCALSDQEGEARLAIKWSLTSSGSIGPAGEPIQCTTLDSLNLDRLDALKIDVEGHESAVLKGGLRTIARCRPLIIAEALTADAAEEIRGLLEPFGYNILRVDRRNLLCNP